VRPLWTRIPLWRLAGLVVAAVLLVHVLARGDQQQSREVRVHDLPAEALVTLEHIQRGGPYPYDRDNTTFGNYEQLLPEAPRGHYREYTVATPGVRHRGTRRIVVGCERQRPAMQPAGLLRLAHCRDGGVFYYTADHYRSFRRIVE
jgi:ribonuclease T1